MIKNQFIDYAITESNPLWEEMISRQHELYSRADDIRTPFARDYTRILHSTAYRRLKHKTQVFFNIDNDHICTRMEHVNHVESVSCTIANYLGLNVELAKAISIGHDMGHAPFGHQGEAVLRKLSEKYLKKNFWHEQNGLRFADSIELLEDNRKISKNLNLTYAVRDGIISHCGELDQNGIKPRCNDIKICDFIEAGQYQAVTWEGCIVKMADKIAYIGRDIEDAVNLKFLNQSAQALLRNMAQAKDMHAINTTVIIHNMIIDICENSSPEKGIAMSVELNEQLNELKKFNYKYIYNHKRLNPFKKYSELVITQIFDTLKVCFDKGHTISCLEKQRIFTPMLVDSFETWLARYCDASIIPEGSLQAISLESQNEKIYGVLNNKETYYQAIIDYISGMTDRFAIKLFNELLEY